LPGAAVAVMKDGRLVFARGYGYADTATGAPVMPDTLFRIASVSKPITAACILTLVEAGRLSLDATAFPLLDLGQPVDARINRITIRNLLEHTGGWDRDISFDPLFKMVTIARAMGVQSPPDGKTVIRYMLAQPLEFDPGSRYAYSNFGYVVLGRVIEKITGQGYEEYARSVLSNAGISRMKQGHSLPGERFADEATYYDLPGAALTNSVFDRTPGKVPWPDGGYAIETHDANGGWLASAVDLVAFAAALDGKPSRPDVLSATTLAEMVKRPGYALSTATTWYAKGWSVNGNGNIWHTGSLPGTKSLLVSTKSGYQWALLTNMRAGDADQDALVADIDDTMWNAYNGVTAWPAGDLVTSSALSISSLARGDRNSMNLSAPIQVALADVGKPGSFFVAALWNGQLWLHNGKVWSAYTTGALPPFSGDRLGSRTIGILTGANLSGLTGAQIYAGYGTSAEDMLANGKYRRVYIVP
jgi:N-acyl-D-amino-acid deacylase